MLIWTHYESGCRYMSRFSEQTMSISTGVIADEKTDETLKDENKQNQIV